MYTHAAHLITSHEDSQQGAEVVPKGPQIGPQEGPGGSRDPGILVVKHQNASFVGPSRARARLEEGLRRSKQGVGRAQEGPGPPQGGLGGPGEAPQEGSALPESTHNDPKHQSRRYPSAT